jgi:hypothetical protein
MSPPILLMWPGAIAAQGAVPRLHACRPVACNALPRAKETCPELASALRRALWRGLRDAYGPALPERAGLKLVYQDGEGDLLLLLPDLPWPHFLATARRVIVSCK